MVDAVKKIRSPVATLTLLYAQHKQRSESEWERHFGNGQWSAGPGRSRIAARGQIVARGRIVAKGRIAARERIAVMEQIEVKERIAVLVLIVGWVSDDGRDGDWRFCPSSHKD